MSDFTKKIQEKFYDLNEKQALGDECNGGRLCEFWLVNTASVYYICCILIHVLLSPSHPIHFFHLIIGHHHARPKYSRQEGGYHQYVPFVFWPWPNFLLLRPSFMSKYVLLKYSPVLAKFYQGSDSYYHRYAQMSAKEVIVHSSLKLSDGINVILKNNLSVVVGVLILA